jgi:N-acyl homoserine lactone hydrolase
MMSTKTLSDGRLKVVVTLLSATMLSACREPMVGSETNLITNADGALRLYVFDCGKRRSKSMALFNNKDDETDVRELIVPCYIVDHPFGTVLWDGGLPSKTAAIAGWCRIQSTRAWHRSWT